MNSQSAKVSLHIHHSSGLGGAENSLLDLVRHLPVVGYNPVVMLPPDPGPLSDLMSHECIRLERLDVPWLGIPWLIRRGWSWPLSLLKAYIQADKVLRDIAPDIVHINSLVAAVGLLPWMIIRHVRPIVHIRDLPRKRLVSRLLLKLLLKTAEIIVVPTTATREYLVQFLGEGTSDRIQVVYNGIDFFRLAEGAYISRDRIRVSLGVETTDFLVGVIGAIAKDKGQDTVLRAISVDGMVAPVKVLFLGRVRPENAAYYEHLQNMVADLGLEKVAIFHGECEEVASYYRACDALVCPSRRETFGRVVIEGMYLGIPIIASRIPAFEEIVGGFGLLFEPGNHRELYSQLCYLAKDAQKREELKEKGKDRAGAFDIGRHVLEMHHLFERSRSTHGSGGEDGNRLPGI